MQERDWAKGCQLICSTHAHQSANVLLEATGPVLLEQPLLHNLETWCYTIV